MIKWKVYKIPRTENDKPIRVFDEEPPAMLLGHLATKHGRIQMEGEEEKEEQK